MIIISSSRIPRGAKTKTSTKELHPKAADHLDPKLPPPPSVYVLVR